MAGAQAPVYELLVPYLRSCKKEVLQPVTGIIKGIIPSWLQGTLLRIGCGLLEVGEDKYHHIFDGLALMHKFSVEGGEITYENRFLKSDTFKKNMEQNRIAVSEFGTRAKPDPCKTIFNRFSSLFSADGFTDNDLVNIVRYTDQFYACSESNFIWKVDPYTLESVEKVDLRKFVLLNTASAHPHEDTDGTVYNVGYGFLPKASYVLIKIPPKGEVGANPFLGGSVVGRIPATHSFGPSYFHSFGMSTNYFIFVEQSFQMSMPKMMYAHFTWTSYAESIKWKPKQKTRFHVVRRDTGELIKTKYLSDPFVVFHHINAYEEDDHLIVDLCWCPDGSFIETLYVEKLKELYSNPKKPGNILISTPKRFVLPLNVTDKKKNNGKNLVTLEKSNAKATIQKDGVVFCEPEELVTDDAWSTELPRINYESFNQKKYKYFYSIAKQPGSGATALLKVDTEDKTVSYWEEEGALPSEPVFVASPSSSKEDDGVILASLLSSSDVCKVSLLVLNAKDMTELGRADFQANSTIPGDFHGIFIPLKTSQDAEN